MSQINDVQNCRRKGDRRSKATHPLAEVLAGAIVRDEVKVLFQPQFSCVDGVIVGAEALARWEPEGHDVMTGDELFDIVDRTDLALELSQHVFDTALQDAREWSAGLCLSLNITAGDLADPEFAGRIAESLSRSGFAPECLTLEITEQALVDELESSAAQLQHLVELGVKVALDDFGAGFCNFRYLKSLPLHSLKLDRSMVEGIGTDQRDLEVLRGIIAMASALDLAVVAEGIETQPQREAVTREGCTYWQGFLGAKPMTAAEFRDLVESRPLFF